MTQYFISRHEGAREWARRRGIDAIFLDHLDDPARLRPGDTVFGSLPLRLIDRIVSQGIRYVQLDLPLGEAQRGQGLTADQMERAGADLVEYHIGRIGPWDASKPARPEFMSAFFRSLRHSDWRQWLAAGMAIGCALAVAASSDIFANVVWEWIGPESNPPRAPSASRTEGLVAVAAGSTLVFVAALLWLFRHRHRILAHGARINSDPSGEPRPVLITGLSVLGAAQRETVIKLIERSRVQRIEPQDLIRSRDEIAADPQFSQEIASLPWLQNLRAVWYHRTLIRRLLVIASAESEEQLGLFKEFLHSLFPQLTIQPIGFGIDFEHYDAIQSALREAIDTAKRGRFSEVEVSVDITSGTKLFSAVAAAVTFGPGLRFLYVSNAGVVRSYDAEIRLAAGLVGD